MLNTTPSVVLVFIEYVLLEARSVLSQRDLHTFSEYMQTLRKLIAEGSVGTCDKVLKNKARSFWLMD